MSIFHMALSPLLARDQIWPGLGNKAWRPHAGDVAQLGPDVIHSVTNPVMKLTGAIHVYGGDFFATERSEWDPGTLTEQPYNVDKNMRLFAESNARLHAA
jgi:predicted metal-dependent enzyme (double-stranded beta helix superfamily)